MRLDKITHRFKLCHLISYCSERGGDSDVLGEILGSDGLAEAYVSVHYCPEYLLVSWGKLIVVLLPGNM
jgi:hypothetical protein